MYSHSFTTFSTFVTPDARFDNVHVDIIDPLSLSKGLTDLLKCITTVTVVASLSQDFETSICIS